MQNTFYKDGKKGAADNFIEAVFNFIFSNYDGRR
jgi:hypothetical protein